jgi:undecaprenyl-diphosphatase
MTEPVTPGSDGAGAVDRSSDGGANARTLAIALLSLLAFVLLTMAVAVRIAMPFDPPILAFARTLDGWPDLWRGLSQSANIPLVVIGLGMVVWLVATHRRREAFLVLIMLAAVTVGSEGIKELVARPRPSGTDPAVPGVVYSYPSGHTLEALTIMGIITIRGWRSSRPLAGRVAFAVVVIIWVVLVGLARMALNEHYPSDVLGGVLGGIGALSLYAWFTRPGAWADQSSAHPEKASRRNADRAFRASTHRQPGDGPPVSGAGPKSEAGPATEGGPLARVNAVGPALPAPEVRPRATLATMTVVVGFAGLIASLLVLGVVAEGVRTQEVFALDTWATPFLHGIASPGLDAVMNALTDLGTVSVIGPIFVVVVAWLTWKRRYGGVAFLGVASAGSLLLQAVMKLWFERPRPKLPWAQVLPDYSFPSGHTMNAIIFYVALALIVWSVFGRRIGVAALVGAIVLALAVGVSRIYLGYHYLTDVVGGLLAGIAWLLVVGAAFNARPRWWYLGAGSPRASRPGAGGQPPSPSACRRLLPLSRTSVDAPRSAASG